MLKNFFFSVADTEFIVTIYRGSKRVHISQVHRKNPELPMNITCAKYPKGWSVWFRNSSGSIEDYFSNLSYQDFRQCIVKLLIS